MGLVWSDNSNTVTKRGSSIVATCDFPPGDLGGGLWSLWRQPEFKELLVADGFGVFKESGRWMIKYYHKIGYGSFDPAGGDLNEVGSRGDLNEVGSRESWVSQPAWRRELGLKCQRWGRVTNEFTKKIGELVNEIKCVSTS
jgi:hypothetical protein